MIILLPKKRYGYGLRLMSLSEAAVKDAGRSVRAASPESSLFLVASLLASLLDSALLIHNCPHQSSNGREHPHTCSHLELSYLCLSLRIPAFWSMKRRSPPRCRNLRRHQ
ncbi:hypothetical protein LZ32DRAFT_12090 [Colletotrichum eremochloae]|nr:hypothetical protein LZ32DRAFT_12090 [Colletotrichum eremochloae]